MANRARLNRLFQKNPLGYQETPEGAPSSHRDSSGQPLPLSVHRFSFIQDFQLSFEEEGRFSINVFFDLLSKRYNVQPLIHSLNLGVVVRF